MKSFVLLHFISEQKSPSGERGRSIIFMMDGGMGPFLLGDVELCRVVTVLVSCSGDCKSL